MLNPNIGGLQSKQLTLGGIKGPQALTPKPVGGDEPVAKPNAVWIGSWDEDGNPVLPDDLRPGDIYIDPDGCIMRYCIDADGNHEMKFTDTIRLDDYETDRGDLRRHC